MTMLRTMRLAVSTTWAGALLFVGLWMWDHQANLLRLGGLVDLSRQLTTEMVRLATLWTVAAAQFVFLVMVADEVFPGVKPLWRDAIKVFVGTVFYLATGLMLLRAFGWWS